MRKGEDELPVQGYVAGADRNPLSGLAGATLVAVGTKVARLACEGEELFVPATGAVEMGGRGGEVVGGGGFESGKIGSGNVGAVELGGKLEGANGTGSGQIIPGKKIKSVEIPGPLQSGSGGDSGGVVATGNLWKIFPGAIIGASVLGASTWALILAA